jgi:RNA recognition motif-containing protein
VSYQTTEGDIQDLFSQAGTVVDCNLVIDKFTSKSRGFAFVEMSSQDEANKAIEQFNGSDFQGRSLVVNEARPREARPPRDFGGGGGGGRDRGRDRW